MEQSPREELSRLESLYAEHPEGRVFTHLAEAYRKAGELERARDVLVEGLEHHADYPSAHVVLGRVLTDQGEAEAATGAFKRVLELDPQNLVALRTLGDLARQGGRSAEAIRHYRELIRLDAGDDEVTALMTSLEEETAAEAEPEATAAEADPGETAAEAGTEGADTVPEVAPAAAAGDDTPDDSPFSDITGLSAVEGAGAAAGEAIEADPADEPPAAAAEASEVPDLEAGRTGGGETPEPGNVAGFEPSSLSEEANRDLHTETMAELYARQGLYERAAQVYRQLLEERPGDAELERRLADVERLEREQGEREPAGSQAVEPEAPPPGPSRSEEPLPGRSASSEPLPGLPETDEPLPELPELPNAPGGGGAGPESLEAAWTAGEGIGGEEITPYAWTEGSLDDEADDPAGGTKSVREYFRELLAWRPSDEPAGVPATPPTATGAANEADAAATPSPTETDAAANPPAGGAGAQDAGGEDTDDIEAFRDWLNSLKR